LPSESRVHWQWFHINAVKLDHDGRHTWSVYKVNRITGNIIWTLGGKGNNFILTASYGQLLNTENYFSWQHDPESLGNGIYTIFDNEAHPKYPSLLPYSRAITFLP